MNVGLDYITDEDWFVYQEDDLVIQDEKWLEKMISIYKTIDNSILWNKITWITEKI